MSCLDSIVTLGLCPDDEASISGFRLIDAPGISPKNLAAVANENYIQGTTMAMAKKSLAILQVQNDFLSSLQANRVVTSVAEPVYQSSTFNTNTDMGNYAGERGIVFHKNASYRGTLRQSIIKSITCYPLQSGEGEINIYVPFNSEYVQQYTIPVTFVANQINTFDADTIEDFPFIIPPGCGAIKILVDQTDISFASAPIFCMKGCNGTMPNDCGWVQGWDGTNAVKSEGYGININFYCHCNYEQILCDLAKSFTGELIWLKWQIAIMEEHYRSNKFNNWVIYNRDEIQQSILPDLNNQYAEKWNGLMQGLFAILQTYKDECLKCRGIRWKVNG